MTVRGQTIHYKRRKPGPEPERVKVVHKRPRKSIFGLLFQTVAQLVIFALCLYAFQLAFEAHQASDEFYASTATGWTSWFSLLTNWARYWVIAVATAFFTMLSWPLHGAITKLIGGSPLAYGIFHFWWV